MTLKPATSSPSLTRPGDLHRAAVPGVAVQQPVQLAVREREPREALGPVAEAAAAFGVLHLVGVAETGAPSAGAVPRWSVWPWPSTMRLMPPSFAPALATARVIVRAPGVEQRHAVLVLDQVHVAAAGLPLHDPHALGDQLGLAAPGGRR